MVKDTKNTISIDDKTYNFEDLTDEQKGMVAHLQDLERKIQGTTFQLDQLNVGHAAFINMLKASLEVKQ